MSKEQEFMQFLIKQLVDDKEAVQVNVVEGETTNVLEIKAATSDYGKIIGKKGRVVNAIRILLGVVGRESGKRWLLDVPNKEGGSGLRQQDKPQGVEPKPSDENNVGSAEASSEDPKDSP